MRYWLMKSEPAVFSFDDLKKRPNQTEPWNGVRNYQARNYLRDLMQPGDAVLFYHSSCALPGIPGLAEIVSKAMPDPTQWEAHSPYFDPRSSPDNPRWVLVNVRWKEDFARHVSLAEMKAHPALAGMLVLQRGQRLSIQPVEQRHFEAVRALGNSPTPVSDVPRL